MWGIPMGSPPLHVQLILTTTRFQKAQVEQFGGRAQREVALFTPLIYTGLGSSSR